MHKSSSIWQMILRCLQENRPVILLYVLESSGSSPGRQGFMMAVDLAGNMQGSLGGGIMEHKLVELARTRLKEGGAAASVHHQVHNKSSIRNQSGMICSGEQKIFMYRVQPTDQPAVVSVLQTLSDNRNAALRLSPSGLSFSDSVPGEDYQFVSSGESFQFTEKIGYKNELYIIGGGHCALAFSQLMRGMDFYIRLFDDRSNLFTMQQNTYVHEQQVIADYTELETLIRGGDRGYVVIMTFGYRTDAIALKALLGKSFRYLGLLGSASKIRQMFDQFKTAGIDEQLLSRVHAPVGIPIKSETPEEIAVSIAAEIIRVKNNGVREA